MQRPRGDTSQKIMKYLIFSILLLSINESFAQLSDDSTKTHDTYIVNTTTYKKGIYKNFEEFKFNNPSIVDDFVFDNGKLSLTKPNGKNAKIKKFEVWGFSDGTKVFIRTQKYNEILAMGRYCYFKESGIRPVFLPSSSLVVLPIPTPYTDELIINFNTGKTFLLSEDLMKIILTKDDPELLTEFLEETQRGKKLGDYILKYNDRNSNKIK